MRNEQVFDYHWSKPGSPTREGPMGPGTGSWRKSGSQFAGLWSKGRGQLGEVRDCWILGDNTLI